MNKIKIEKYLEITDKEREESETIENPLTLKQLCYMQCAMDSFVSRDDPILNDFANKISEMLLDKEKFKKAKNNFL